jgi:hypothetical protein
MNKYFLLAVLLVLCAAVAATSPRRFTHKSFSVTPEEPGLVDTISFMMSNMSSSAAITMSAELGAKSNSASAGSSFNSFSLGSDGFWGAATEYGNNFELSVNFTVPIEFLHNASGQWAYSPGTVGTIRCGLAPERVIPTLQDRMSWSCEP